VWGVVARQRKGNAPCKAWQPGEEGGKVCTLCAYAVFVIPLPAQRFDKRASARVRQEMPVLGGRHAPKTIHPALGIR